MRGSPWTISSFSKTLLEPRCFAFCYPQIIARDARPFLRGPRGRFQQMRNRQARPQGCPVAPVEAEKFIRNGFVQRLCQAPADARANPRSAKPFAFDAEKRYFIEGIDCA